MQQNDGPPFNAQQKGSSRETSGEEIINVVRIDFGKRLVSIIIDLLASYLVGAIFAVIPFVNRFVGLTLVMTLVLLIRDCLFQGRGIGKNIMGLQVIDVDSGKACTFCQSIIRNIIVLGPLLLLYIVTTVLSIISAVTHESVPHWGEITLQLIIGLGTVYICLILPYEAYRVYYRSDSRRFGDYMARTTIVEAPMDFSHLLPKR